MTPQCIASPPPRRRRRTAARVAVSTVVTLALAECTLAWLAPQILRTPRVWQHDADLGWAHRPGARGLLWLPEVRVEIAINAAGLRGPEVAVEKPAGVRRVALFGDSLAEGWGVAEPDTLRARLETRLRTRDPRTEVLSFGVAGYGTDQALLAYQRDGGRFAPDVVALLVFTNDLWDNVNRTGNGGGGTPTPKPWFQIAPDGFLALKGVPVPRVQGWDVPRIGSAACWRRLGPWIADQSHVAALVASAWRPSRAVPWSVYYERLYGDPDAPRHRGAWKLTARLVEAFAHIVRARGARLVVVYVPAIAEVEPETWRRSAARSERGSHLDLEQPSRLFGRAAEDAGAAYLDLLPAFRAAAAGPPLYLREGHMNAAGHERAANELEGLLRAQGWVD